MYSAHDNGSDILTLSLGTISGWAHTSLAVAAARFVEAGVPITVAAGNNVLFGLFLTSPPRILLKYFSELPEISMLEVIAEACNTLPPRIPDLPDYITLVRRRGCLFIQKLEIAAAAGARLVLIYDKARGIEGVGMVTAQQCAQWVDLLAPNNTVDLSTLDPFTFQTLTTKPDTLPGGYLSNLPPGAPITSSTSSRKLQHAGITSYARGAMTVLDRSSLLLRNSDHATPALNFTIHNLGSHDVAYSLDHINVVTAHTLDLDSIFPSLFPLELFECAAELQFSEQKLFVALRNQKS
ncbi:hypothetical protein BU25DRAFT_476697 [Macroventuria anomochaeta]|uniref:Uncharacterized protein n=1 Tax=Macroventuria anomochaeta TaxID=301207 RepID=A0ACB6RTI3_9PLEO|nr:uncharacterized protein BU25DRAFT_476697 [Macroventuria anomochaeta]KAF2624443.1 hypothetical protein BU25DRAFT_476697 [Macroventuria anomochaeta]